MVDFVGRVFTSRPRPALESPVPCGPYQAMLVDMNVFPIKSCAKFQVSPEWSMSETGLSFDREWTVVENATGFAMTHKNVLPLKFDFVALFFESSWLCDHFFL